MRHSHARPLVELIALAEKQAKSETIDKTLVLRSALEDEQCPTNDYTVGEPQGSCCGDGHYECNNCKHYREDFKRLGQDYIDFVHQQQGAIHLVSSV